MRVKSKFSIILITIIVTFSILTIVAILNRGSPAQIAGFASVPIAIVLTISFFPVKRIEEYLAMFMTLRAQNDETNYYSTKATNMLQSYIKFSKLMSELIYVNYNSLDSFNGIRLAMKSSEDVMKCVSEKIYSRIVVADARGFYTKEDYEYLKKKFDIGREANIETSELLNLMSDMGANNLDLTYIIHYNESLRKLNDRAKEDFENEK